MIKIEREIVSPYKTNCYFVFKNNKGIIIDPGGDCQKLKRKLDELKEIKFEYVLNTHGHEDHTFCDNFLKKSYNMKILIHEKDLFFISNSAINKNFWPDFEEVEPDILLKDGDELNLGELKVKVIHTPGHTPGSSIFIIENLIFSGDTIFKGTIGRYDFEYSSSTLMKNSILKILNNLCDMDYIIYPGHGNSTTLEEERETLIYFLDIL
ncbi:MAG: MBL fold metallo-hydrolase [Caldisericia bacterium]|jgi:glyoxylase-like metal-dependent hydrolase (beta-lactamase superfamily II)|nr:MBL fold metallo-hydrolase [Caldisericia bacterium]